MKTNPDKNGKRDGSVLIVVLILGTAIALAIGSFIAVTNNAVRMSHRSYYANSSLDLAEAGLEEALYALNNDDWTGWTTHSSGTDNKFRTLPSVDLGQGATGSVGVLIQNATTAKQPTIIAEGRTSMVNGSPVIKQIKCVVGRRSHWGSGMVAKEKVVFSGGNGYVDSYSSCDPTYSTGGLYDSSKKRDRGSVASARVVTEVGVSIGNADIWGYVATAGSEVDVGPNGTVKGEDTPSGVKKDPDRITKDFPSSAFYLEEPPTSFDATYASISGTTSLGTLGTTTSIKTASMFNTGTETIDVYGDVTLYVTNEVDIKGNFFVQADSKLTLYVGGNLFVGGTGQINKTGLPENLVIYGTSTTSGSQTIKLHGSGQLHASVYGPHADVELKGGGSGGEMSGSVVGNSITLVGNYKFHYDECLDDASDGNPFTVASWRELDSAAERVALY